MFDNVAIDVAIGLIFIFLLYSLLATILMEFIARWFGMRQRFLARTIIRMLDEPGNRTLRIKALDWLLDLGESLWYGLVGQMPRRQSFAAAFYAYPLIKMMAVNRSNSKPSYISADTFSQTIIALLRPGSADPTRAAMSQIHDALFGHAPTGFPIKDGVATYLKKLWSDANGDIARFKALLEIWYNETNERSEGGYKRLTQMVLLAVGFMTAVFFNIDTISISRILIRNNTARKELVLLAEQRVPRYASLAQPGNAGASAVAELPDTSLQRRYRELEEDARSTQQLLGLGWRKPQQADSSRIPEALRRFAATHDSTAKDSTLTAGARYQRVKNAYEELNAAIESASPAGATLVFGYALPQRSGCFLIIIGWIITALAICLGAPFWFDLLNRIMMLRSSSKTTAAGTATGAGPSTAAAGNTIPPDQRTA